MRSSCRQLHAWRQDLGALALQLRQEVPGKDRVSASIISPWCYGVCSHAFARYLRLGALFVALGGFEGQEHPIFDGWPCEQTDLVRQLANALRVAVSQNKR